MPWSWTVVPTAGHKGLFISPPSSKNTLQATLQMLLKALCTVLDCWNNPKTTPSRTSFTTVFYTSEPTHLESNRGETETGNWQTLLFLLQVEDGFLLILIKSQLRAPLDSSSNHSGPVSTLEHLDLDVLFPCRIHTPGFM